jgi:glyoxylase-like metal-dependent hydrolase (beta-lactamase superfamily II)
VKVPKESKVYDTDHGMNREALDERVAWLVRVLGRQASPVLAQSNARARATLARAVDAHGGEPALRGITSIWLEEEGTSYMRGQSPLPGRPFAARPFGQRVMLDFSAGRGCHAPFPFTHTSTDRVEDMWYLYHPRTVVSDGQVTTLDLRTRSRSAPRPGTLQALQAQRRLLPTTWLVEALDNAHTLQWLGETAAPAATLVGMTGSDGRAVTLRVGPEGLLAGVDRLTTDPAEGDAVTSTSFEGYRPVSGVLLPERRINRVGDDVVSDMRITRLRVNDGIDASCLEIPASFSTWPPQAARPETAAVRLAEGVYQLRALGDAYNALAVLFSDHVLVVEAPEHETPSGLSATALRLVASVSGGRPVRYLAFTHYHGDHGGGVRDYIAEGATILTTAGTKAWVESAARSVFEIKPDRLARSPRPLSVRVIGDRFVLEDSTQRVEFHMVAWDHAQEELVVYLPKARVLFEGDLFASGNGDQPIAQKSAEMLRDLIRDRALMVDTIVGVHGRPRPAADLDAALERRQQLLRSN